MRASTIKSRHMEHVADSAASSSDSPPGEAAEATGGAVADCSAAVAVAALLLPDEEDEEKEEDAMNGRATTFGIASCRGRWEAPPESPPLAGCFCPDVLLRGVREGSSTKSGSKVDVVSARSLLAEVSNVYTTSPAEVFVSLASDAPCRKVIVSPALRVAGTSLTRTVPFLPVEALTRISRRAVCWEASAVMVTSVPSVMSMAACCREKNLLSVVSSVLGKNDSSAAKYAVSGR